MEKKYTATSWKKVGYYLLFAAVVLGLTVGRAEAAPAGSPWGANYFPNITLINQDGKKLRFYDDMIKDKVVAINFMYATCHDSCPLETAKLRQVQEALGDRVGKDIFMYSITITPEHDTPESLKAYMEKYNVGPGWQFLTGNKDEITMLRTKLGLYDGEETEQSQGHTMSMVVGNETTGQWIKRSSFDNPNVMARMLGEVLSNHKNRVWPQNSYADAPELAGFDHGADLFQRRCQSCHTVGAGDALGPDLLGVVANRDRTWLQRWIKNPDQVLAAKDPIATELYARYRQVMMPNLRLNDGEVDALIGYLDTEGRRVQSMRLESMQLAKGGSGGGHSGGSHTQHRSHGEHQEHAEHRNHHQEHLEHQEREQRERQEREHQEDQERDRHRSSGLM